MKKHNVNRDDLLLVTGKAKSLSSQPTCDAQHKPIHAHVLWWWLLLRVCLLVFEASFFRITSD